MKNNNKTEVSDGSMFSSAALGMLDADESVQISMFDTDLKRLNSEVVRERGKKHWPDYPVVYFVQELSPQGFIKIGYATHFSDRHGALQSSNPYGVDALGFLSGDRKLEIDMHRKFQISHFRAEWFYPTKGLLQFIREQCQAATGGRKDSE